jgi:predicted nucleic acid-binding protein
MWFFKSEDFHLAKARFKVEEYLTHEKSVFSHCNPDGIRFASRVSSYSDYNDYVILSVAKRFDIPIFTFDAELGKKASKYGIRAARF